MIDADIVKMKVVLEDLSNQKPKLKTQSQIFEINKPKNKKKRSKTV